METKEKSYVQAQKHSESKKASKPEPGKKAKKSSDSPSKKYLYRIFYHQQYFWTISASNAPERVLSSIQGQAARKPLREFSRYIQSAGPFKEEAEILQVASADLDDEGRLSRALVGDIREVCSQIRQSGSHQGIVKHKISSLFRCFLYDQSQPLKKRIENLKEEVIRLSRWIDFDLPHPGYLALLLELEAGSQALISNADEKKAGEKDESESSPFPLLARAVYQAEDGTSPDWYWNACPSGSVRHQRLFFRDFISQELLVGLDGEAAWFYPEFSLAKPLAHLLPEQQGRLYGIQLEALMNWDAIKTLNVAILASDGQAFASQSEDGQASDHLDQPEEKLPAYSLLASTAQMLADLHPDKICNITPIISAICTRIDHKPDGSMMPEGAQTSCSTSTDSDPANQAGDSVGKSCLVSEQKKSAPSEEKPDHPLSQKPEWKPSGQLLVLARDDENPAMFTQMRAQLKQAGYSSVCFYVLNGQKSKVLRQAQDLEDGGFDELQIHQGLEADERNNPKGPFDLFVISLQHVLGFCSREGRDFLIYSKKLADFFEKRKEQCILYAPDHTVRLWLEGVLPEEKQAWLSGLPRPSDLSELQEVISSWKEQGRPAKRILGLAADESLIRDFATLNIPSVFVQWGNRYQDLPTRANRVVDTPDELLALLQDGPSQAS